MRFLRLISLLSILAGWSVKEMSGCYQTTYPEQGYFLFKLPYSESASSPDSVNNTEANCREWQRQTSINIPIADIRQTVYKSSLQHIDSLRHEIYDGVKLLPQKNDFESWIVANRDTAVISFLYFAKSLETERYNNLDPWYFPRKRGVVHDRYGDYAQEAMSRMNGRFFERYAVQAARAMTYAHRYDECVELWHKVENRMITPVLRRMILNYAGGAYFNLGLKEKAEEVFIECGDMDSFVRCYDDGRVDKMKMIELINKINPNTEYIRYLVSEIIRRYEYEKNNFLKMDWMWERERENNLIPEKCRIELEQLLELAVKMASDTDNRHRSMWYYTAAYATDLLTDDAAKASALLSRAEAIGSDSDLIDYIRVCRFYLDAKRLSPSVNTDHIMLGHIRWLDSKIAAELPILAEKLREEDAEIYGTQSETEEDIEELYNWSSDLYCNIKYNISYFYWNDMMRKIVIGELVPKLLESGDTSLALLYSAHADCNIRKLWDRLTCQSESLLYLYSTGYYSYLDNMLLSEVEQFASMKYTSELQRYLSKSINRNRLNELLGTRMIRDGRFDEAVKYLKKLPHGFEQRLNTIEYLARDPFDFHFNLDGRKGKSKTYPMDSKLSFARCMVELQRDTSSNDADRRGCALVKMGVAWRNVAERCWAYAFYRSNWYDCPEESDKWNWSKFRGPKNENEVYETSVARNKMYYKGMQYIDDGLKCIVSSELKAEMLWQLCLLKRVVTEFPDTRAAKGIRGKCDMWNDYYSNSLPRPYI